jgi:hypothetical protein
MKLAQRITRIKPSATLTINTKAQELRAAGRQIVSLAVGEPDFRTPEHVCDAAKAALDQGFTRYTPVPWYPRVAHSRGRILQDLLRSGRGHGECGRDQRRQAEPLQPVPGTARPR